MNESVYIVDGTPSQRHTLSAMGATVLASKADVAEAVNRRPHANSLWIARHEVSAHWLAYALANSSAPVRGRFLAMKEVPPELATLFAHRLADRTQAPFASASYRNFDYFFTTRSR